MPSWTSPGSNGQGDRATGGMRRGRRLNVGARGTGTVVRRWGLRDQTDARGTHWWKVSFGRCTGWVDEQARRYQGAMPLNFPIPPAPQPEP